MPFREIQAASELPTGFDLPSHANHDLHAYISDVRLTEVGGRLRAGNAKANARKPWKIATSFADNSAHEAYFQLFYKLRACGAPLVARMFYAPHLGREPTCRLPGVRAAEFAPGDGDDSDDSDEDGQFAGVKELMVVEIPDMALLHLYGAGAHTDSHAFYRVIADVVYLASTLVRAKKTARVVVLIAGTCYRVGGVSVTASETQERMCDYMNDMYKFRRFAAKPRDRWNDYVTVMSASVVDLCRAWKTLVTMEEEEEEFDDNSEE